MNGGPSAAGQSLLDGEWRRKVNGITIVGPAALASDPGGQAGSAKWSRAKKAKGKGKERGRDLPSDLAMVARQQPLAKAKVKEQTVDTIRAKALALVVAMGVRMFPGVSQPGRNLGSDATVQTVLALRSASLSSTSTRLRTVPSARAVAPTGTSPSRWRCSLG